MNPDTNANATATATATAAAAAAAAAAVGGGNPGHSLFYEPGQPLPAPLTKDPFKACIVPRPIGWISTRHPETGDNLAPYSQFFQLTFAPPYCAFAANQTPGQTQKDSARNAETTGVFCWNQAGYPLRHAVNTSAQWLAPETDEFGVAGMDKEEARLVDCPMVRQSKIKFECRYYTTLRLPGDPPMGSIDLVVGRVIGIHIDSDILTHASDNATAPTAVPRPPSPPPPPLQPGMIDYDRLQPIARMGYNQYAVVSRANLFAMDIAPTALDRELAEKQARERGTASGLTAINAGLEGNLHFNRDMKR